MDALGKSGVALNRQSGDGFRNVVAAFLRSQGRAVTTDAQDKAALTFNALGKNRVLDMMVQNNDGNVLGFIETKFGTAGARYEGSFQQAQDEWLRQNLGLTIDIVSGGG